MARAKQVRAISSFDVDGKERLIRQGEVHPANSRIVKGCKELFEEQPATAASK
jgi:hypothetical protein